MRITLSSPAVHIAELQKIMAEEFRLDNGPWSPLAGKSAFDDRSFTEGEDGDWGSTCRDNVAAMQRQLGYTVNGSLVDDFLWSAITVRNYGGDATEVIDVAGGMINAHSLLHGAHAHKHTEGRTSLPVRP
ncbi:hypothetical protein LCGC14_1122130 [marine sediment metagenome]|uniref:Peptidoglycan binding-like domain-containing protein n=1 Tax=marine sediment metagenome TaxID=412755 RepID=A0A0F9Q9F1_9ZZZZ